MIPNVGIARRNSHAEKRLSSTTVCLVFLHCSARDRSHAFNVEAEKWEKRNGAALFCFSLPPKNCFPRISASESFLFILFSCLSVGVSLFFDDGEQEQTKSNACNITAFFKKSRLFFLLQIIGERMNIMPYRVKRAAASGSPLDCLHDVNGLSTEEREDVLRGRAAGKCLHCGSALLRWRT